VFVFQEHPDIVNPPVEPIAARFIRVVLSALKQPWGHCRPTAGPASAVAVAGPAVAVAGPAVAVAGPAVAVAGPAVAVAGPAVAVAGPGQLDFEDMTDRLFLDEFTLEDLDRPWTFRQVVACVLEYARAGPPRLLLLLLFFIAIAGAPVTSATFLVLKVGQSLPTHGLLFST
jgi:hypothetical protein